MMYQKPNLIFGPRASPLDSFNSPLSYQKGEGFGSFFKMLFKNMTPVVKKVAGETKNLVGRALKSDIAKQAGRELLSQGIETSANILGDLVDGKNVKESVKSNLSTAKQNIADTLKTAVKSGIKRRIDNINAVEPRVKQRKKVQRKEIKFAPKGKRSGKVSYNLFDDYEIQK